MNSMPILTFLTMSASQKDRSPMVHATTKPFMENYFDEVS